MAKTQVFPRWVHWIIVQSLKFIKNKFIDRLPEGAEIVKNFFAIALEPLQHTSDVLSDGDPKNGDQVKAVWEGFIKAPENQLAFLEGIINPALARIIKDPEAYGFVTELLENLVRNGITGLSEGDKAKFLERVQRHFPPDLTASDPRV